MGWFKKLTGISTPSVLKKADDAIFQPVTNAVGDVAKIGISLAALPVVTTAALLSGGSVSDAIAELPGTKSEATKVAIAAAMAGGIYAAYGVAGAAGALSSQSIAAETVAGSEMFGFGAFVPASTALPASELFGGAAGLSSLSGSLPVLATDLAVAAPAASGTGIVRTLNGGISAIEGITPTLTTIAGAAKSIGGAATNVSAAASTVTAAAQAGLALATDYQKALDDGKKKQDEMLMIVAALFTTAIFI